MSISYLILGVIIPGAIALVVAWALWECLRRPASLYALAKLSKGWWTGILVVSLLAVAGQFIPGWFLTAGWLLRMAAVFAAVYFIGPECQRMGNPGRGPRKPNRGGW